MARWFSGEQGRFLDHGSIAGVDEPMILDATEPAPASPDHLRGSPESAREYESAKRAAVAGGATMLVAYSEAKARFVEALLHRALGQTTTRDAAG